MGTGMPGRLGVVAVCLLLALGALQVSPAPAFAEIEARYMYNLSNFTGAVPSSWPNLAVDESRHEVYVTSNGDVRVFNDAGMEVYKFGDEDWNLTKKYGHITSLALDKDGNLLAIVYTDGQKFNLVKLDYRGDFLSAIKLPGLGPDFHPAAVFFSGGHIYLADYERLQVAVVNENGSLDKLWKIGGMLKFSKKEEGDNDIRSLCVDREGNIFFTIATLFSAFRLSPDGKLTGFGVRGSSPGKFNVASGIAVDGKGYIYVTDALKCAVLVFDKGLHFVQQFGYRGFDKAGLIVPRDAAFSNGKLYITQSAGRGVSVYRVYYN